MREPQEDYDFYTKEEEEYDSRIRPFLKGDKQLELKRTLKALDKLLNVYEETEKFDGKINCLYESYTLIQEELENIIDDIEVIGNDYGLERLDIDQLLDLIEYENNK